MLQSYNKVPRTILVLFLAKTQRSQRGLRWCISLCVLCAFARDIFSAHAFFGGNLRHSETKSPVSSRCFLFSPRRKDRKEAYGGTYPLAFFAPLREIFSVPRRSLVGISGIAKRSLRCPRAVFFSRQDAKIAKGLRRCIPLCVLCDFARDIFSAHAFFGGNLRHSETKSPVSSRCFLFSPRRKDRKEDYGGAYPFAFFARDIFHSL